MDRTYGLLIVDDSSLFRNCLKRMVGDEPGLRVVGEAENGEKALAMIPELSPDVVVLDVNMPVMDGLTALKHIMIRSPTPTVMFSALTKAGARTTFEALKFGAVDFIQKPSSMTEEALADQKAGILRKIGLAAGVRVGKIRCLRSSPPGRTRGAPGGEKPEYVFGIGAAEGGMGSLLRIAPGLSPDLPAAFLVVLHEEPGHVDAFAEYLGQYCRIRVRRARHGDFLEKGAMYLASGREYLTLVGSRSRRGFALHLSQAPFAGRRGSVNMLLFSLAEAMETRAVGVLLSGAGEDGTEGLAEIARRGGVSLVQDPASCLCEEMVRSALVRAGVHFVYADTEMSGKINQNFDQ